MVIIPSEEHEKVTSPRFHLETGVTATQLKVLVLKPLQVSGPSTFRRPSTKEHLGQHPIQEALSPELHGEAKKSFSHSQTGTFFKISQWVAKWLSTGPVWALLLMRNLLPVCLLHTTHAQRTVPSHTRKSRQIIHLQFEHKQILS